jgi:hypothetical protein
LKIATGILGTTETVTSLLHQFLETFADLIHSKSVTKFSSCFGFILASGSFRTNLDSPATSWEVMRLLWFVPLTTTD